ncbi:efflux RND transporter periplasmic adaptor subunit [Sphingomonas sp. LY54]|uniref:efflux RND transporter periplasmic adaptor subunit n=1 Tax=Sphingomonas sp. LY54 TaxID=3095343 RepID=UPI002D7803A7|nr:efflux RND transporter periplasmic adaptor subunit [Sphingomonas sp. LY54]WRP28374.1 efflux RND transporter periplasmic adaptor subunit [Sphingomonas sp. LY54]
MSKPGFSRAASLAAAMVLALAGCSQEAPPAPPPPEVEVITVRSQQVPNVVELPGRVQAVRTAEVRARVDGIVQRRLYEEGTDVGAGQGLFAIDPRELRASLGAVQASLARARANAANAQQDVNRYRPLLADQAISKQEYDAAVARLRSAQADVAQAQAQVESAQLSLGYTTVRAPISGRAGRAQVTEGALVSAAAGTLLTTIEQINPIYVNFSQSSSDLLALRRDLTAGRLNAPSLERIAVQLQLEDGSSYGIAGHIDFLDLSIDEATGTAALRAEFPNPGRLLLPGQFVRARVLAGVKEGIMVPQRAVQVAPQGGTVMVVGAKNIVEARPVRLGSLEGSNWVVLGGLKPGDKVIVSGLQKVQPGQPVRIAGAAAAKPQPAAKR